MGLKFRRQPRPRRLAGALEIPDPQRVEAVNVQAVADRAVVWPVSPGAIGTVALWNLGTGQLAYDLTLSAAPLQVVLDATGARVLAATDRALWLWNAGDGSLVARVATQTEFVLPPIFSADGAYVAIAERVDGASPLYSVLRSADGSLVTTLRGPARRARLGARLGRALPRAARPGLDHSCARGAPRCGTSASRACSGRGALAALCRRCVAAHGRSHGRDRIVAAGRAGPAPAGTHGCRRQRQRVGRRPPARLHARRRCRHRSRCRDRSRALSAATGSCVPPTGTQLSADGSAARHAQRLDAEVVEPAD